MERCGLQAIVATSAVNVTYLSDYYCWLDRLARGYMFEPGGSASPLEAAAVLPLDGEPTLLVSPMFAANAEQSWVRDVQTFGSHQVHREESQRNALPFDEILFGRDHHAGFVSGLAEILEDRGLAAGWVGIDIDTSTPQLAELQRLLPRAEFKDCSNLLRLVRTVKSADEFALLRRAAEINELAAFDALRSARPGVHVAQLVSRFRSVLAELGADFDHFAFGPKGFGISTEIVDFALADDDVMYADFGCTYRGVFADSGTTLALGHLPADLEAAHQALAEAIDSGLKAMRPGVLASQVHVAMVSALAGATHYPSFPHGHGLGLEVRDYPILVPATGLPIRDSCIDVSSDLPLESDMVINLEAAIFLYGRASIHIERSFHVHDRGTDALVQQDRAPVGA
jgi:Xaa-Pro aminopeptidase